MVKSIDEIPLTYRSIFENYKIFNSVQSEVFDDVFNTNKSIIVSAPTGSGKTVIFELAIVRLLQINHQQDDFKIVYVAPIKALCNERFNDWSRKFHSYGLQCLEVTGDSDIQDFSDLISAKIIITTPEKWDSLTRKWKENENIVTAVKLFMIDEIHLLNEDGRGPILEAIVSRMKTIQFSMKIIGNRKNDMCLRFIGASATIPNIKDLAEWIGGRDMNNISYFQISEEQRPVKLEKHILGYTNGSSSFKFDIHLNYKLADIIRKYSNGKPTLIFCSSRKSVEMASDVLQKYPCLFPLSYSHKSDLAQLSRRLQDKKLHGLIIKGIAYHHAGLTYEDRNTIENGFRQGLLMALVSTNTLAMGVNLPAHLVIIKSTETFIRGTVIEYSESSILQMIGRAGRPQFDVRGVAVIMTQQKYVVNNLRTFIKTLFKKKYENLMNGCTPVESHLHKHLTEHLNSEIVLQTITDIDVAMEWIRSTFLYVRAVKSPMNYGLTYGMTKEKVEKKLEEMCLIQINDLETNELITKDQTYGLSINATQYGRLMARYYISFETMKLFRKIRGNESYLEIFNKIIETKEFSEFTLRVNDKKILNDLNDKPIRFPIKGKIKTNTNKVSCLIQANFGAIQIPDPAMMQDSLKMIRLGDRISKCCLEYVRLSEKRLDKNYGIYKALLHIIMIAKCYRAKLWENSEYVCKQLNKIGNVYSSLLVNAGKTTLKSILDTEPRTLEMILGKQPPFGNDIHRSLLTFPDYELQLTMKNSNLAQILVKQMNQNYKYDKSNCTVIVGDSDNRLLLLNDKVDFIIQEYGNFERTFKIRNCKTHAIYANLIHESLVGVDKSSTIILNPLDDNDEEIVKKSENKKRIQTKLTDCPIPQKKSKKLLTTKKPFNEIVEKLNESEGYESLLDDDEIFNNINTQKALLANKLTESKQTSENYQKRLSSTYFSEDNTKHIQNTKNLPIKRKLSNFEFEEKPKIPKMIKPTNQIIEISDDEFEYLLQEAERDKENFIDMQLKYGNCDSLLYDDDIDESRNKDLMEISEIGQKWEITEIRSNQGSKRLEISIDDNHINTLQQNRDIPNFQPLKVINNQKIDAVNNNVYQLRVPSRVDQQMNEFASKKSKLSNSQQRNQNCLNSPELVSVSNSSENNSILDLSTKNAINCETCNYNYQIEQKEPLDFSLIKGYNEDQEYNSVNQKSSIEPLSLIVEKKTEYPAAKCNSTSINKNVPYAKTSNIQSFMNLEPCFADQNKESWMRRTQKRKFDGPDRYYTSTAVCKLLKQESNPLSNCRFEANQFNDIKILPSQNKFQSLEQPQFFNNIVPNLVPKLEYETEISSYNRIEQSSNNHFGKEITQQPIQHYIAANTKETEISPYNRIEQSSNNHFGNKITQQPIQHYIAANTKIIENSFPNNEYNQKLSKFNKLHKNYQNFGISNMNISSNFAVNKISELWKQNLCKTSNIGKWEQIFSNTLKNDTCSQILSDDEDIFNNLNYQDSFKNQNLENSTFCNIENSSTSMLMKKSKNLGMTNFNSKLSNPIENIARPQNIFRPELNFNQEKKFFQKTEFVKASEILDKNNLDEGLIIPQNHIWKRDYITNNNSDINKLRNVTKVNEDSIPLERLQENVEDFIAGINETPKLNKELLMTENKEIEIASNSENGKQINDLIVKQEILIAETNKTPELCKELRGNEINLADNKEIDTLTISKVNFPKQINDLTIKEGIFPTIYQPHYPITQKAIPNGQIIEILQIICIGKISVNFDSTDIIIQIPNYQSETNNNEIPNQEIELFFAENISKLNQFENSSKLVRLQDINDIDEQSDIEIPIINFSLPKPNLYKDITKVPNKLFSADNRSNPYRLRIPRREKIIPVENRAYLDEQEQKRKFALNNLQRKLYSDPNYDENSYMNDYISCLMSKDVNQLFDDFGIVSEEDDNFLTSQNELKFNESQDNLFGSSNEIDNNNYESKKYYEEENCNENITENSTENDFILEFSQNLKENSSYYDNFYNY